MTKDEMAARMLVIEVFAMAALATVLRLQKPRLPPKKAVIILDSIKKTARGRLKQEKVSQKAFSAGDAYLDHLLSEFSEHLLTRRSR
jgi:hypothetical protein